MDKNNPPQPPEIEKKLQIAPLQRIGIPLLALVPLLALLGVFGEGRAVTEQTNEQLALHVDYASRHRYQTSTDLHVDVTNVSQQELATVTVRFDRSYLDGFTDLVFYPGLEQITDHAYEVELANVGAGETRTVEIELMGEKYWLHRGEIEAATGTGQPVAVELRTFIFP